MKKKQEKSAHGAPDKREAARAERADRAAMEKAKKAEENARKQALKAEKKQIKAVKRKAVLKKVKITAIIVLAVLALLTAGAAVGGYYVTKSEKNLPRVYVDGIFVGGMDKKQTEKTLDENNWNERTEKAFRVKLPAGVSFKLDVCQAGAVYTREAAVEMACSYGHSGNIFENLMRFLKNYLVPVDVSEEFLMLNMDYIQDCVQKGIEKFENRTADSSYVTDEKKGVLRMRKGAGEMEINPEALCAAIAGAITGEQRLLEYNHIDNNLSPPDFEAIYRDLAVEPRDAAFDESFNVTDEVVGCTFDPAQALKLWEKASPGEKVEIPLEIQYPETTADELRAMLYRDVLGSWTTEFPASNDERINNLVLATEKINGIILMPGDTFSYNGTVGQRTEEAGFKAAGAYNDGEVVQEVGGGVCQVSSTLYTAAMYAQMKTVERTSHYFKVSYMDYGFDATVSWPGPDYKFQNTRDYPVKIHAVCDTVNKTLKVEILGTDVDGSYVKIHYDRYRFTHPVYTDVIIGFNVYTFRDVYDKDDNFLYQIEEPVSTYNLHKEDINLPEEAGLDPSEYEGSEAVIIQQ